MITKLVIFILTIFQMLERFEINSVCPMISPTRNWILCYSVIKVPATNLRLVCMNYRLIFLEFFRTEDDSKDNRCGHVYLCVLICIKSLQISGLALTVSVWKIFCAASLY